MAKKYKPVRSALLPEKESKRPEWMDDPKAIAERYGTPQYQLFQFPSVDYGPLWRDPAKEVGL